MYKIYSYEIVGNEAIAIFARKGFACGASALTTGNKQEDLQKIYIKLRKSLQLEQDKLENGFQITMPVTMKVIEDKEDFLPEDPKATDIKITGDKVVEVSNGEKREILLSASIFDQYGDEYNGELIWKGANNGVVSVGCPEEEQDIIYIEVGCENVIKKWKIYVFRKNIEKESQFDLYSRVEEMEIILGDIILEKMEEESLLEV
jgi:hypothetical protein